MAICNGCGGIIGRDCFNPQECEWITQQQANQSYQLSDEIQHIKGNVYAIANRLKKTMGSINSSVADDIINDLLNLSR